METSEVLNRAADLIEERGWAIGNCGMDARPGGMLCLEGALGAAAGVRAEHDLMPYPIYSYAAIEQLPAYRAVQRHVEHRSSLYYWNDSLADSASHVIEVLRACAVIEASRERESAPEPVAS